MTCFFDVDADDLGRALDVPDDHVLAARLHDWRHHAVRMDYPRLFAAILADSQVAERALATGRGERLVTNVHHVFEHLHAEVERSRCELPELVARLRGWIRAARITRPDDSDVQRQETDRDAVQVMTVHRAKGLEAWVVFLAGGVMFQERSDELHGYHDADGRRRVALRGTDEIAKAAATLEKRGDETRLAYVALTRARGRLYLPLLPDKNAKVKKAGGGWLGAYAAIHDNLTALAGALGKDGAGCVDVWPRATPRFSAVDVSSLTLPPVTGAIVRREPLAARAGWVVTSYTRIKHEDLARAAQHGELEAAEVQGDDRSRVAPGPRELPGGAESGQYLHQVLEHVDFAATAGLTCETWASRAEVAAVFAAAERRHGIDPIHRPQAAQMVWDAITQEVVAGDLRLPPLAAARRLAPEVEFVYPLSGGRGFVKGFIDLIVAWDDRWWVVDYKSDVIDVSAEAAREHVDEHYTVQAELYALACARMLGLRDAADHAARFGGLLYWFLRSRRVVRLSPTAADLAVYEARLAGREFT
jgi:exodeoxyribonuclease V beta subunit